MVIMYNCLSVRPSVADEKETKMVDLLQFLFQAPDDCAISIANIIRHHEAEYLESLEVLTVSPFPFKFLDFKASLLTITI